VVAIFAHSSSGPVPLRTLTLGVLIVSGGTLAALPFRRYQAIPDSSTNPVHVTGPTNSALQMRPPDAITQDAFRPPQASDAMRNGSILATHSPAIEAARQQPRPQDGILAPRQRRSDVPLTYEDLMLPIEMPAVVQERFNATAAVKSIQMEKERLANKELPRMEKMVATQTQPSAAATDSMFASSTPSVAEQRVMQPGAASADAVLPTLAQPSVAQPTLAQPTLAQPNVAQPTLAQPSVALRETAAGSLASTSVTPPPMPSSDQLDAAEILPNLGTQNKLPSVAAQSRQRHWIQQPD
jgi:hypothetical protein